MFIYKWKEYEVIFDSKEQYDLVTMHGGKKPGRRKIWIDDSRPKPYALLSCFGKNIKIHHIIAGYPIKPFMTDHFNGNSLDNRAENLRTVTRSINSYNKPSRTDHRWITKQKNGRYIATARIGLGTFNDIEDAKKAVEAFLNKQGVKIYKGFYE